MLTLIVRIMAATDCSLPFLLHRVNFNNCFNITRRSALDYQLKIFQVDSFFYSRTVVREDTFIHRFTVSKVPNPAAENSPENNMREPAPAYKAVQPAVSNT